MTDAPARLHLIAYLRELPDDASITLDVQYLSREQYDQFVGENERLVGGGVWVKTVKLGGGVGVPGGVEVSLYTREAARQVLSFPFTRRPDLRVVGS